MGYFLGKGKCVQSSLNTEQINKLEVQAVWVLLETHNKGPAGSSPAWGLRGLSNILDGCFQMCAEEHLL